MLSLSCGIVTILSGPAPLWVPAVQLARTGQHRLLLSVGLGPGILEGSVAPELLRRSDLHHQECRSNCNTLTYHTTHHIIYFLSYLTETKERAKAEKNVKLRINKIFLLILSV